MALEIQVLSWDRHNNMAGIKPVNGIQTFSTDNYYLQPQYRYKQRIKNLHRFTFTQKRSHNHILVL